MANREHVDAILKGPEHWNAFVERQAFAFPRLPDLRGVNLARAVLVGANLKGALLEESDLRDADLSHADLEGAKMNGAQLSSAKLVKANLSGAKISGSRFTCADMSGARCESTVMVDADMWGVKLTGAIMPGAQLPGANIWEANLDSAVLTGANLFRARLVKSSLVDADLSGSDMRLATLAEVDLSGATLSDCYVYGVATWDLRVLNTKQHNLYINNSRDGILTVDNMEVAQFIHLLTNNPKIRNMIDTITSKTVLILGRFTPERKRILDALRAELLKYNYVAIVFDFDKPASRSLTETVSTLAQMSKFVIADLSDAKSIPQELQRIVPDNPSLPVIPLIVKSQFEYAMFKDFLSYPWVLEPYRYDDVEHLLDSLRTHVIDPAIEKANAIAARRRAFESAPNTP